MPLLTEGVRVFRPRDSLIAAVRYVWVSGQVTMTFRDGGEIKWGDGDGALWRMLRDGRIEEITNAAIN